jgi:hypothetical protein
MLPPLLTLLPVTSDLPELTTGHEVLWLGGRRIFHWVPETGSYRLYETANTNPQLWGTAVGTTISAGVLPNRVGRSYVWLGGNRMLEWMPGYNTYTALEFEEDGSNFPGQPLETFTTTFEPPGRLSYVGRGYVLWTDTLLTRFQLWRRKTNGNYRMEEFEIDPAVRHWIDNNGPVGSIRFTWLGDVSILGWNAESGATVFFGSRRPTLARAAPVLSMEATGLTYVGQRRLFGWGATAAAGIFSLWHVDVPAEQSAAIEDYLELHPQVREAISWPEENRVVHYHAWNTTNTTENFYQTMSRFYTNLEDGTPFQFSFPRNRRPELIFNVYLTARDASDFFLAHVTHSLWIEINRRVPWYLHDYNGVELYIILNGACMFISGALQGAPGLYRANSLLSGQAMPMDSTISFAFLGPLVRASQHDTIMEVSRWMRDHLTHGATDQQEMGASPWVDTMLKQYGNPALPEWGDRHWAWEGCHSASALLVWLSRAANIPARRGKSFIEDVPLDAHSAIDFPHERLFCVHADELYAVPETLDPTMDPAEIYTSVTEYAAVREKYTTPPPMDEDRPTTYKRYLAFKGLLHPTHRFMTAYWHDLISTIPGYFDHELRNSGFTEAEIAEIKIVCAPLFQNAIAAFVAGRPAGEAEIDSWNAYNAEHAAWLEGRR